MGSAGAGSQVGDNALLGDGLGSRGWLEPRTITGEMRYRDTLPPGTAGSDAVNGGAVDRPHRRRVSVVIPVLNEARNLPWVLRRLPANIHEVILVDGRSVDGTVEVALGICPDIVVVVEPRRGKGRALRAGFAAATGDCIVMLDGDGSMDPREIPLFVEKLRHDDFVKGSRCLGGGDSDDFTWVRRMGNRTLLGLVNGLFGQPFTDLCYGYCAFRRTHLDRLNLTADGFEIETQLVVHAIKAGLRISEVPSVELVRIGGISNLRVVRDGPRVLRTIVRERLSWFGAQPPADDAGAKLDGHQRATSASVPANQPHAPTSSGRNGHAHAHANRTVARSASLPVPVDVTV